jgi:glycosyltransferase involved in cell wall biosynthesis
VRLLRLPLRWVPKPLRAWAFDRRLGPLLAREGFDFVLSLGRTSHQDAVLLPGNHLGFMRAMGRRRKTLDDRLQVMMDARAYAAPGVVLACSEMMRDEVVELYGADPAKIKVLYPPTDTARFNTGLRAQRDALRARFGMDPHKTSLVLVSASHGRKGLPLLLEVFARLADKPFELLVAGEEAVPTHLKNVGFVKDTEALFAAADFTVLPALYEPFGQVVSESILCGTPVLVSPHVGAKAAMAPGEGLVVADLRWETWLDAIERLPGMQFQMPGDFAERNGVRLEDHMRVILACKEGRRSV